MDKPNLIVEWNDIETSATGWMVVHNFVKGYAGGGIRMHPTVTQDEVRRLARGMAYKYQACESVTCGGCKGGIVYDYKAPDAKAVLKRYLMAMIPYIKAGVSLGGDLGVNYDDVLDIYDEFGVGIPQTLSMRQNDRIQQGITDYNKSYEMKYDGFPLNDMVTGYGVAFAADEAWQFKNGKKEAKVVIQGFGCVGASCALKLQKYGYKIVGISDANILAYCEDGLDIQRLITHKNRYGEMDQKYFEDNYQVLPNSEWLSVDCDILIPAALEDVINHSNAHQVTASLIVEGANIPTTADADKILQNRGIDVVVDFVANLGACRYYDVVIFGAVTPEPDAIVDDIEDLCRRNTQKMFSESERQKRYQREVAFEIFKPVLRDTIDI